MNINIKFFLWAVGFAVSVPPQANAFAAEKVAYVSQVPPEIRKGAIGRKYTRFFGKTTIDGQNLAFHFYDTGRLETDANGATFQKSRLDVYAEVRNHNRFVYKRINAIPLTYRSAKREVHETEKHTVQIEKLWLNPGTHTQPILHLNVKVAFFSKSQEAGEEPYEAESGNDILVIFPQGWAKPTVVQQFDTFGDPGSFRSNDFGTLDKQGVITVYRQTLSFGTTNFEGWKWNGTQFIQVDSAFLDRGEIGECRWDGEKITKTVWNDTGPR